MNISSMILPFLFGFSTTQQLLHPDAARNGLIVKANAGTYRGLINGSAPHVREFLGIPYAQPPTGDLRWIAPQKIENSLEHVYDATQYEPACPQWVSKIPSAYNTVTDGFILSGPPSEDCLGLSIWTPTEAKNLPVLFFIHGGGFQVGGMQSNYQLPYNWVERTQSHIVVTLKYGKSRHPLHPG
jgi:carboxylesterase type B